MTWPARFQMRTRVGVIADDPVADQCVEKGEALAGQRPGEFFRTEVVIETSPHLVGSDDRRLIERRRLKLPPEDEPEDDGDPAGDRKPDRRELTE